jgi:hypothetical protein
MMGAPIRVVNHIPSFVGIDDIAFAATEVHLKRRLSRANSVAALTRRTIGGALDGLRTAVDRDTLLTRVLDERPAQVAWDVLTQLTAWLPPADGRLVCHLVPNGGDRGSGNCFGADRLLATVPCRGDVAPWIRFVIAHEYSHTQRGFRLPESETVRDDLIFEGLAMVLAETIEPAIGQQFRDDTSAEEVADFWAAVDLDAAGLDAYMHQMSRSGAYEAGAAVVRAYLRRHRASILDAHRLSNRELYWESGYPRLK